MNKTSRKILSSLIASTMIVSMLPGITVFADTEAEEGTEGTKVDAAYSITIDENSFESPDLRAYVSKNFDTNQDGKLDETEIANAKAIDMWEYYENGAPAGSDGVVTSTKGLELLPELTKIKCDAKVTDFDASANHKLEVFDVSCSTMTSFELADDAPLSIVAIYSSAIETVDLSKYTEITDLTIFGENIKTLDFSGANNIISINISLGQYDVVKYPDTSHVKNLMLRDNLIAEFKSSNYPALEWVLFFNHLWYDLEFRNCPNLDSIYVDHIREDGLDISQNSKLTVLDVSEHDLSTIDLSNNPELEFLSIESGKLKNIDLSNNKKLEYVDLSDNKLSAIDVSALTNLKNLDVSENVLTNITFGQNTKLEHCFVYQNQNLTSLDTSNLTSLTRLSCSETNLSSLDISKNPNLKVLSCDNLPELDIHNNPNILKAYKEGEKNEYDGWHEYHYYLDDDTYALDYKNIGKIITEDPTSIQPDPNGVENFCERLYTVALGRASDPQGKAAWAEALKNGSADGAKVASGFIFSKEFEAKELSNTDYVKVLYKTFMDREADPAGLNAWVKALDEGATRQQVFNGFIDSVEWANICHKYGIKSGGSASPTIRLTPSEMILAFTERLYTTCLGRPADPSGLKAWAEALANREGSGAKVAHGFFFSDEFKSQDLNNKDFVTRLYKTFMDREPDPAGLQAWVKALNDGASREKVFDGFTMSPEFGALCEKAGIQPY